MQLGDLLVNHADAAIPPKLAKALAVIGVYLHPTFDRFYEDHASKDSCVLSSLVLRDFLFRLGFTDVEVRPVCFHIERRRDGEVVHSLAIGRPGDKDRDGRWNGHLVVVMPKAGWLIDSTLYQAQRKQWGGLLPSMVATPTMEPGSDAEMQIIAGFAAKMGEDDVIRGMWLDEPDNTRWRAAPVAKRGGKHERHRRLVADGLLAHFGSWTETQTTEAQQGRT